MCNKSRGTTHDEQNANASGEEDHSRRECLTVRDLTWLQGGALLGFGLRVGAPALYAVLASLAPGGGVQVQGDEYWKSVMAITPEWQVPLGTA